MMPTSATEQVLNTAPAWVPVLREIARKSAHETRNALNGVVVNLEVVRSIGATGGERAAAAPFLSESLAQSEESVRLAESTIALLDLVLDAVGPDGVVQCQSSGRGSVSLRVGEIAADRAAQTLAAAAERGGYEAVANGPAVILTIPETSPSETE